jgi:type I restriction enzyme M protein
MKGRFGTDFFLISSREPICLRTLQKEQVRQRIARALFHEYGFSVEDMERDFSVAVGGKRRRADLAIFKPGAAHTAEHLRRVVICRPEPKLAKRGAVKMRDFDQAASDLDEIKPFLTDIESCQFGLWTNGLEFFFLQKKASRFQVDTDPIGDWPPADETVGTKDVVSHAHAKSRPGHAADRLPSLPQLHPRQ